MRKVISAEQPGQQDVTNGSIKYEVVSSSFTSSKKVESGLSVKIHTITTKLLKWE